MIPRVMFVITDSGVGGTEKVLDVLLKNLDRKKVRPCAVVILKRKREMVQRWENHGVPVFALGMGRLPSPRVLFALKRAVKEFKPNIVHAFLYHSIQFSRLLRATGAKFRLVSSPRVNYRFANRFAIAVDRMLRKYDDLSITESEAGRRALIDGLGYEPKKVRVARNSVDGKIYCANPGAWADLRKEWGIKESETLIGAVGRLHQQKGFDVLIEALARMRDLPKKFKAVIVGDGPDRAALEKLAREKYAPVKFLGQRADIPRVLSAVDIYVQSSRYEGLSNALLEAMSVGCSCVATAVDGTMDLAKDGSNMLLVKPEDPDSLAAAIGYLIENPRKQKEFSENAKMTAQVLSQDRMVSSFEQAYADLMK